MSWFDEALHGEILDAGFTQRLEIAKLIHRNRTNFQEILIFDTPHFGRVLALDGIVQTTQRDEFAYHEMLVHVPVLAHGAVRRVLIIGGGDGGCLREALHHKKIELVRMVELDAQVVELCRRYMPSLSAGAFDDPRADLIIADGCQYLRDTDERFDVIVIDSTDPMGPSEALFSKNFYEDCRRRLDHGGILVVQGGVPVMQPGELSDIHARLTGVFADATIYLTVVPTYIGGHMALGWGSDCDDARRIALDELEARYSAATLDCRYYSPAVHQAAFALPPFIAAQLSG